MRILDIGGGMWVESKVYVGELSGGMSIMSFVQYQHDRMKDTFVVDPNKSF